MFRSFSTPPNLRAGHEEPSQYYNNNKGVHSVTPMPQKAVATAVAGKQSTPIEISHTRQVEIDFEYSYPVGNP
jgi:hypothetical protein